MQGEFLSHLPKKVMLGGSSMEKSMCHFMCFCMFSFFRNVCFHDIKPLRSAFKLQTWTVTCSQFQHISTHPTPGSSLSWEPNNGILMMLKQRATSSNGELENQ
jgi:hypothetical protein